MIDTQMANELADWLKHMQEQSSSLAHIPEMARHIANLRKWETEVRKVAEGYDLKRIRSHLADAAANPGSRENLLAIIEINRDAVSALLEGK